MANNPIDDFLKQFDRLSGEQREQLLHQLEQRQINDPSKVTSGRSLFQAFQERGLIGSIKDAPADWSTNPIYLDGFGKSIDDQ